jgi:hypothetical protein
MLVLRSIQKQSDITVFSSLGRKCQFFSLYAYCDGNVPQEIRDHFRKALAQIDGVPPQPGVYLDLPLTAAARELPRIIENGAATHGSGAEQGWRIRRGVGRRNLERLG